MSYPDLITLARLNKLADEYHYRRAYGGRPHPSHVTEQYTDEQIIAELVQLAEQYATTMRASLPLAVVKGRR